MRVVRNNSDYSNEDNIVPTGSTGTALEEFGGGWYVSWDEYLPKGYHRRGYENVWWVSKLALTILEDSEYVDLEKPDPNQKVINKIKQLKTKKVKTKKMTNKLKFIKELV